MLTREKDESMYDVVASLANTGMFTLQEGKEIQQELERDGYIVNEQLSVKGMMSAKKAESEFKI